MFNHMTQIVNPTEITEIVQAHSDESNSPILVPEFSWYPVMQDDPYYPHYLDPNTRILPPPNFEENDSSCPNDCCILDLPSKKRVTS